MQESSIIQKFRKPVVKNNLKEKKIFVRVYNWNAPRNPSPQIYFEVDLGRISILVFDICGLG
jgi:hypothetical protein